VLGIGCNRNGYRPFASNLASIFFIINSAHWIEAVMSFSVRGEPSRLPPNRSSADRMCDDPLAALIHGWSLARFVFYSPSKKWYNPRQFMGA
jgi:hypothetical protein